MKGILITSGKCPPCDDLKETLAAQIGAGEVTVKSMEENEAEVMALMEKYQVSVGSLVILSDNGDLIAVTDM